ncbi:MAG TPA: YeeE/YedE thiosulfate transporter family protein [Pyrinomonadaceae bacterium]
MNHYTYWQALIGGTLIGLASLIAAALTGKIPGISGVFGRLLVPATTDPPSYDYGVTGPPSQDSGVTGKTWRVVFLIGLIGGAALSFLLWESAALFRPIRPLAVVAVAGLLVGFGTRLGGGCTSGHGVCGVGTGAKDSIAATCIFVGVAMVTVLLYNRLGQ